MSRFTVGVDLGKQADFTALSIVETVPLPTPPGGRTPKPELHIVWLKRLRGVAYPRVIEEVAAMARWPALDGSNFAVDATGLGRPIVDALRERIGNLHAITITGGENVNSPAPREWTVPKADLVAAVQLLLQSKRLRIHDHINDLETLKTELLNFGYTINDSGRTSMGAVSGHDDLVLSVAMACWLATKDAANGADAWIGYMQDRLASIPRPRPTPEAAPVLTVAEARTAAFRERRGEWV
jgi:hypothetical protein